MTINVTSYLCLGDDIKVLSNGFPKALLIYEIRILTGNFILEGLSKYRQIFQIPIDAKMGPFIFQVTVGISIPFRPTLGKSFAKVTQYIKGEDFKRKLK